MSVQEYRTGRTRARNWSGTISAATNVAKELYRIHKRSRPTPDDGNNQVPGKSESGFGVCQGTVGGSSIISTTSLSWGRKKKKKSFVAKLNMLNARMTLNDRHVKVMWQSYLLPQPQVRGSLGLLTYDDPGAEILNLPVYCFNLKSMPFNSYDNTGGNVKVMHWGVPCFRLSKIGEAYSWNPVNGSQLTYGLNGVNSVAWNGYTQCWQPIDMGETVVGENLNVSSYIPVENKFKFMFYAPVKNKHQVVHVKHVKFNNPGVGPRRYGVNSVTGAYATIDPVQPQDLIDSGRMYWDNLLSSINHPLYRPHVPINSPEPLVRTLNHTKFTFDTNNNDQGSFDRPAKSIQYLSIDHPYSIMKTQNDSSFLDVSQQEFGVDPTKNATGTQAMPGLSAWSTNSLNPSYEKDEWLLVYADTYGSIATSVTIADNDYVSFECNCTSKFLLHDNFS